MWVTIEENRVYVTLSRRNLRELQAMLDNRTGSHASLGRLGDNGVVLVVQVEDDSEHYREREPGPGSYPAAHLADDREACVRECRKAG